MSEQGQASDLAMDSDLEDFAQQIADHGDAATGDPGGQPVEAGGPNIAALRGVGPEKLCEAGSSWS